MSVSFKTLPLTDEAVIAHFASEKRVMIERNSRARGGRSHLRLFKDNGGWFVRTGMRGSCKQYLGQCKQTLLDNEVILHTFSTASQDAFDAEQNRKFEEKWGVEA